MKKATLFQRLKTFINFSYDHNDDRIFTTHNMCSYVSEPFTNSTPWKRWYKNPNYTTHLYLGHLRKLGAVTRVRRGVYKINAPIPEWFSSIHFNELLGRTDGKNKYWNSLPDSQKVNPWAEPKQNRIEDALGGWPDWDPDQDNALRTKYPANVEGSIEQRIAAMQDKLIEQLKQLKMIQESLTELQSLAIRLSKPEITNIAKRQTTTTTVEYKGRTYEVINNIDDKDPYENEWYVKDLDENDYVGGDVAELLINFVKENED